MNFISTFDRSKRSLTRRLLSVICLASLLSCTDSLGCTQRDSEAAESRVHSTAEQPASIPVDRDRLLERSREYWQHKQGGDWIQVYDFLSPTLKQTMSLSRFISGKENHIYVGASDPLVLKIEEDRGFVEVHVEWTPTHPILGTVDNAGGSLTQILDEVDEWVWSDGEWWLAQQHRISELRKTHPHLWVPDEQG